MPNLPKQPSALSFIFYPLTATFAINAIILVIIRSVILEERKDIAETEIQKLRVSNLEAQKQVLLQQLHPHFLFNALSTLKSLVREDPEEAENYTIKLSEFLRYSIQAHSNELVYLQDELQFTQYYIEMQKVRFGKAFDCNILIPESVLQMKLPVFALQTLVENAIKHNIFTEKRPLIIDVTFENNMLKISNNKLPKILIQNSGTGLINLNERYKLVSEKQVEIINGEKEFTVFISLLE
jgi:LytS/YehU family sensor histidine kinase